MERLSKDTLARCDEILLNQPVTIRSQDPRLRRQSARNLKLV
jgi:D-3-phosphoglycerate dehydrogenase / 2-oxoglutarate reductase